MSIRPVDYQILMPKVNETAKIQNEEQQRQISHVQQQAQSSAQQAGKSVNTVQHRNEAQKTAIKEEPKGGKKQDPRKKKAAKDEEKDKKFSDREPSGRTIDIRL